MRVGPVCLHQAFGGCCRSRIWMRHHLFIPLLLLLECLYIMCDVTRAYAWHDLFVCTTWLIRCYRWRTFYRYEGVQSLASSPSHCNQNYTMRLNIFVFDCIRLHCVPIRDREGAFQDCCSDENESCLTYEWFMSHISISRVAWRRHVLHMNESRPRRWYIWGGFG